MTRYFILLLVLLWLPGVAQAHLLNMTRVDVVISEAGEAVLTLDVDLTKAMEGGDAYYALTRLAEPQYAERFIQLVAELEQASQIRLASQKLHWQFRSVEWPDAPAEDFTSGLAWPMTRFVFTLSLPEGYQDSALTAIFTDDFKFEEPIALNIDYAAQQRTLSRWLVRNQASPAFHFTSQPHSGGLESADVALWLNYFQQGMLHIVPYGWDHALFVLGLFLGVASLRQLGLLITGFTLAHTVTLGLATYGAIVVSGHIIEPVIALSIAWIALENLLFTPRLSWRFLLVFSFGLVHGLGFAQALKDLGIPSSGYIGALVSFNVGVEIAQLGIVLAAFGIMTSIRRFSRITAMVKRGGSLCIALLASFWFAQRLLG